MFVSVYMPEQSVPVWRQWIERKKGRNEERKKGRKEERKKGRKEERKKGRRETATAISDAIQKFARRVLGNGSIRTIRIKSQSYS